MWSPAFFHSSQLPTLHAHVTHPGWLFETLALGITTYSCDPGLNLVKIHMCFRWHSVPYVPTCWLCEKCIVRGIFPLRASFKWKIVGCQKWRHQQSGSQREIWKRWHIGREMNYTPLVLYDFLRKQEESLPRLSRRFLLTHSHTQFLEICLSPPLTKSEW